MRLKWPLVQHSSHKWKQIRDRDYHHFWSGCQRLVKFQILRIFVWTMACHNYYLSGWKLVHLEELIHSEFHPSQKESFWLWSRNETSETTWSVLKPYRHENFTSYSTACRCAPYCEVEPLRPVAHVRPSEPSLWFCTGRVLNFRPCKYSSEFCLKVLIWGNKDLHLLVEAADNSLIKWNCRYLLLSSSV